MRYIIIVLFASFAFAQQALVLSNTAATGIAPTTIQWNRADVRVEARYTNLSACLNGNAYAANLLFLTGLDAASVPINFMGVGCPVTGQKSLSLALNTGPAMITEAMLAGVTDIIIRAQKDSALSRYTLEAWKPDGTLIYSGTYNGGLSARSYDMRGRSQTIVGGTQGAMGNVAWVRMYGSVVPLRSAMPKDTNPEVADLGSWEFEGNLMGTMFNLTASTGRTYAATVIHPPVLQISAGTATAARPFTLDASNSFDYAGSGFKVLTWQWLSGPSRPHITSPRSVLTTVTDLVAGVHRFQLTGTDIAGQVSSKYLDVSPTNLDINGQPLMPLASHKLAGSVSVGFKLSSVPNAVDVQVTMLKPDGRQLPPVTCTSSPCNVPVDNRQTTHLYKLAYRNASGAVIADSSEWAKAPVSQVAPPVLYDDGEYGWFGSYLTQNGTIKMSRANSDASGRFLAYRHRMVFGGSGGTRSQREFIPNATMNYDYRDGTARYFSDVDKVYSIIDTLPGYSRESVWNHWKLNWSYKYNPAGAPPSGGGWNKEDKFDAMDSTGSNGIVFQSVATSAYTDKTNVLYSYSGPYVTSVSPVITSSPQALTQATRIYIGHTEPWDEANIDLTNTPVGCTVTYEYANSATPTWTTAPTASDSSLKVSRDGRVRFTVPANWTMASVNGGKVKYWRRITVSNCSTWPVISSIKGSTNDVGLNEIGLRNATVMFETVSTSTVYDRSQELHPAHSPIPQTFSVPTRIYASGGAGTFNQVAFDVDNAGVGCSVAWEYRNGSGWIAINPSTDTTTALSSDGTVSFAVPGDWAQMVINFNASAYWLRASVSGCSSWPVIRSVQPKNNGTPTVSNGYPIYRGWCATDVDGSRVNVGTPLEYDPTPPLSCAARFPWQARMIGVWLPNAMVFSYVAKGPDQKHVASQVVAHEVLPVLNEDSPSHYFSGVYLDSMFAPAHFRYVSYPVDNNTVPNTLASLDMGSINTTQYETMLLEFARDIRSILRETKPFAGVAANTTTKTFFTGLDATLIEDGGSVWNGIREAQSGGPGGNSFIFHDDWRPAINPGCEGKGLLTTGDVTGTFYDATVSPGGALLNPSVKHYHVWDRGKRSPMATLASYYVRSNECTGLFYHHWNPNPYLGSDDFYYVNAAADGVLTAEVPRAYSFATKTIAGDFTAMPAGQSRIQISSTKEIWTVSKVSNSAITVAVPIVETMQPGTEWRLVRNGYMSRQPLEDPDRIIGWGTWFPAQGVRIGVPDTVSGIYGDLDCSGNVAVGGNNCRGSRKTQWMSAANAGTRYHVERRDFTKAITLATMGKIWTGQGGPTNEQLETYGNLISFSNPSLQFPQPILYPLNASGQTDNSLCNYTASGQGDYRSGSGCTGIRLRAADGVVLMKEPVR